MKKHFEKLITEYIDERNHDCWRKPLVGFADAKDLPGTGIEDPWTVVIYFIPFTPFLNDANKVEVMASEKWISVYRETGDLINGINEMLVSEIRDIGYEALAIAGDIDAFAYRAGLGTYGINGRLITRKGCSGRFGAVITSLRVINDEPLTEDLCRHLSRGHCGVCIKNCGAKAISYDGIDEKACREFCLANAAALKKQTDRLDADEVCGKCISFSPCACLK